MPPIESEAAPAGLHGLGDSLAISAMSVTFPEGSRHHLLAADSPEAFLDETPTAVMIRQILGSVSQFEKAMPVAKLKGARDRKKADTGKCGGRKSYQERDPEMVALAKKLARYPVNGRKRSLREVAAELEAAGHTVKGKQYGATAVSRMVAA
jgi:hypothetical protein